MSENRFGLGAALWFTTKELAEAFFVTPRTVRRWVQAKLLEPRYRLRSGTCYECVFLNQEVLRFLDQYLARPEDLGPPTGKRTSRAERADTIRRLKNMRRVYARKATAARTAKKASAQGEIGK